MVPKSARYFAERLNNCLDDMGVPGLIRERTTVLSKMLNISRRDALSLLEGHQTPDQNLLQIIASEFEVDPQWLSGET